MTLDTDVLTRLARMKVATAAPRGRLPAEIAGCLFGAALDHVRRQDLVQAWQQEVQARRGSGGRPSPTPLPIPVPADPAAGAASPQETSDA